MTSKPRIALILLMAEWFDAVVSLMSLKEGVEVDSAAIKDEVSSEFDLAGCWTVNSTASLKECRQELRNTDCDLVALVFQVWAEDLYLMPLVEAVGKRPLLVWCYQPWAHPPRPASFVEVLRASGPVGTFEGMGTLRNLGVEYQFVYGAPGDEQLTRQLRRIGKAAKVRRELQMARFGILPARNEQMQSTFVDEFRLRAELGPVVDYLSVGDLMRCVEAVPEDETQDYVSELRSSHPITGVSDAALARAARASLGLAHLAVERKVQVLSLNDISPELHHVLGLRPCLYPDLYNRENILVGLEGDLGAATALFILNRLSGSPVFFAEFWYWDEKENVLVGGHAGVQNPAAAGAGKVWITQDYEFCQSDASEGAHYQFVTKPGRVTLLQLRGTPHGWQALAALGECVETQPWLEGYPHAVFRPDVPVGEFLRLAAQVGTTQHFIIAYGDVLAEVETLCAMLKIPLAAAKRKE